MFRLEPTQSASVDVGGIRALLVLTASHYDLFQNADAFWFRKTREISQMPEVERPLLGCKKRNLKETKRPSNHQLKDLFALMVSLESCRTCSSCFRALGSCASSATSCNFLQFTVLLRQCICSESWASVGKIAAAVFRENHFRTDAKDLLHVLTLMVESTADRSQSCINRAKDTSTEQ